MSHSSTHAAYASPFLGRRRLLQAGTLGLLGLDLAGLWRAEQGRASSQIRSCILLFYYGGPSHLDTWDMKPGAPREVRGPFGAIATSVPGLRVGGTQAHT